MLEELFKRIQHCCTTLRRSTNKRNVGGCWLKSLTSFKLSCNNSQQHATVRVNGRNMWHPTMLELLANNFASVWTGLLVNFLSLMTNRSPLFAVSLKGDAESLCCSRVWVKENEDGVDHFAQTPYATFLSTLSTCKDFQCRCLWT